MTDNEWSLRSLLGLKGRSGFVLLGLLLATIALIMTRNFESTNNRGSVAVAFLLMAPTAVVVVRAERDPLALPLTVLIVALGPALIALTARDMTSDRTIWTSFAYSYVLCLLVVRGRMLWAWCGVALMSCVAAAIGVREGFGADAFASSIAPAGTVAAVSLFAYKMQPTLQSLRALRHESTLRAAAAAMLVAENEERQRQLRRLDSVTRPVLETIARGEELDDSTREECRLLEAQLRDQLRAPELATETIARAARQARGRGVDVSLLAGGALADVSSSVRSTVREVIVDELNAVQTGTAFVRIRPVGRPVVATVLVRDKSTNRRVEIDASGTATVTVEPDE
ncbi:hypothetical protein [Antrihabitans sp. YC2-6]|uniref:hypothetical protein n=1 Tax=Antrihabitans sp. YC2-6 TaxID=2799498 RepID=UPI0018F30535|nr:hypothetical protein [Antrihabitans sp. YC2-6]MBJ8346111.1 hypothetical protein [Antrihabitans sp. YC2-6]